MATCQWKIANLLVGQWPEAHLVNLSPKKVIREFQQKW
jgi:hypothetical protein